MANREQRSKDKMKMKQKKEKQQNLKQHTGERGDDEDESGDSFQGFNLHSCQAKMDDAVNKFKTHLQSVTVGRASPGVLENISVLAYGAPTPLKGLAQIANRGAQLLVVNPHDPETLKAIEKAIRDSDLNANPIVEGSSVHVPFPKPTREYRDELLKQIAVKAEDSRTRIRTTRKNALDDLRKLKLPQDDEQASKRDIQRVTDEAIDDINSALKNKETDINTV